MLQMRSDQQIQTPYSKPEEQHYAWGNLELPLGQYPLNEPKGTPSSLSLYELSQ